MSDMILIDVGNGLKFVPESEFMALSFWPKWPFLRESPYRSGVVCVLLLEKLHYEVSIKEWKGIK